MASIISFPLCLFIWAPRQTNKGTEMWEEKLSHAFLSSGDKFSTAELPRNLGFYRNVKAFLTRYQGVTLPR